MRYMIPIVRYLCIIVLLTFHQATPFQWEASLDRGTGVAASKEVSWVTIETPLDVKDHWGEKSKQMVASWTDFLCQKSMTFGILQAKHDPTIGAASLHLRGLPMFSILTFGPLTERRKYVWEIPILPGWLARPDPIQKDYFGRLRFELKPMLEGSHRTKQPNAKLKLESSIVDYRPWLVGPAPVSRIRKYLYLNSQSQIHAYVTWRFHKAWGKLLSSS